MKLYFIKGACSLAVRIILHELEIECSYESVNTKENKTSSGKDYLKINPKGVVPALELDNHDVLTEVSVVLQYLADMHDAKSLLPDVKDIKRYHVMEWLNYVATEMHKTVGSLFQKDLSENEQQKIHRQITKKLDFVNYHLASHPYLSGEEFTLPDAYCYVIITWLLSMKMDLNQWPNVKRYFQKIAHRDAVVKALKEETSI